MPSPGHDVAVGANAPVGSARETKSAEALFIEARTDMKLGAFGTACAKFASSYEKEPAPGTLLNLALCEQKLGRLASSALHYRQAAESFPKGDSRVTFARREADRLVNRVPTITLVADAGSEPEKRRRLPAGSEVALDGAPAAVAVPLPVDPGTHAVVVRVPGSSPRTFDVVVAEGESKNVVVLGEAAAPAPVAADATARPTPPPVESGPAIAREAYAARRAPTSGDAPESGNGRTVLGFVGLGVGALGLGVGTFTMIQAIDASSSTAPGCDQVTRECKDTASRDAAEALSTRASSYTAATVVAYAVGAVGLGTGIVLLATHPSTRTPTVSLLPGGVSVSGRF
ncbi:MAG: hypothetical protein U0169_06110 [Polyangiaceae bacterium]